MADLDDYTFPQPQQEITQRIAESVSTSLVIFHTSDIHNHLTWPTAQALSALKAHSPGSLLLDSGDAIRSGNIMFNPWGEQVFRHMNFVPYDAMCMGNREFHFLHAGLTAKTSGAAFPVLSANLVYTGNRPKRISRSVILHLAGLCVGIFGLTVPMITERMAVHRISDYHFDDPIESARREVLELRAQCDVVIALTHIGIKNDVKLADTVDGIDLILGGHTHTVTEEAYRVGNTWILHHGSHGRCVGRVEVSLDGGRLTVENTLIHLREAGKR